MKLYGIIGKPLGHSFSKGYFTRKFETEGVAESRYENFPLDSVSEATGMVKDNPDMAGFNVTIPYKQQIIPLLDSLDQQAQEIGAVNCVKVIREKDGGFRLKGYNTDASGFEASLLDMIGKARPGVLVLGTGGASKAVCYVLKKLGIGYKVVSRTGSGDILSYEDLNCPIMESHRLIINTTPLGTYPDIHSSPAIPYGMVGSRHLLMDLVYNPSVTEFMRKGMVKGATVKNGYAMLVGQAEEAYRIWEGK